MEINITVNSKGGHLSKTENGGTQLDFFLIKLVTKFSRRWQTLRQPAINLWVPEDSELSNIVLTLFAVI